MTRAMASRVAKLERKGQRPSIVRNTVLNIDALTREVMGKTPKGPCMVVYHHGTDDEWQAALMAQQERLIAEARNETNERHTT